MRPRIHLAPVSRFRFTIPIGRYVLYDQFRAHLLRLVDGVEAFDAELPGRIVDSDD
jgi:hypothetical protein